MAAYTIDFEPVSRRGQYQAKQSLLACARRLGAGINSVCGAKGTCQSCKVQVLSGIISEPTPGELKAFSPQELEAGWRLACQAYPLSDCKLIVPPESMTTPQRTQVEGLEIKIQPEPSVQTYRLQLSAPSVSDQEADAERLLKALRERYQVSSDKIDIDVLRALSPKLRSWNWKCQATVRHDEVIALNPWSSRQLGLAIDLGTTKVAGYLVDLSNGQTLVSKGIMNPQISYGEDIISRITGVIKSPDEGLKLQKLVVKALNEMAGDLCAAVGANTEEVVDAVVVANTAMHHLFLGLPVRQLALSPFAPAVSRALDIKARNLGLHIAPGSFVHLLPNIAGFVGADHVAMLLATEVYQAEGPVVAIDIGTNTEVSLIDKGKITVASCASGPAFEGGHIKNGMRAARGAIERLRITDDSIQYQTIDDAPPAGICGSGVLDAIAQLHLHGIIDEGGRMKAGHRNIRTRNKQREVVLVNQQQAGHSAIVITQQDVRELQLAKAAIRTGIQTLLEVGGYSEEAIKQVTIAGAFGSYINLASAVTIGMLPPLSLDRFRQVGNAAGMGAKLALISIRKRDEARAIAARASYIELASAPNFEQMFMEASYLGRYQMKNGKREAID